MYQRRFRRASQTREFTITHSQSAGWTVRDEQDDHVLRSVKYDDWHRVERATMAFASEARSLLDAGWVETD
jgi:hypothetical protein